MEQLLNQGIATLFAYVAGILACKELIEYIFTKNLPWISRLIRNGIRRAKRFFRNRSKEDSRFLALNFSGHPVLPDQQKAIQKRMGWPSIEVIDVPMGTVKEDENFLKTAIRKVDDIDLLPNEWQTFPLVAVPSGYSPLWSALLAEIHGRLGHFPDVVRLRPAPQGEKEKFEVAEILDLRDVRHQAREKR